MATQESAPATAQAYAPTAASLAPAKTSAARHSALVRVTHWIITLCFFALLITGANIIISHPRFYWGETGNDLTTPLFRIPIPASRDLVPTGYKYVMPDENGWSRALHFEAAWIVVLTALLYGIYGVLSGHFRRDLVPVKTGRSWRAFWNDFASHLRFKRPSADEASSYNSVQRVSYLAVIFLLFPLIILTGLAMSPTFNAAFPSVVGAFGGRQSARTLHFLISIALLLFVIVHVTMIFLAGFWRRTRAMITGRGAGPSEDS
jgi:thiosulfate reductase cytochrome b subunit